MRFKHLKITKHKIKRFVNFQPYANEHACFPGFLKSGKKKCFYLQKISNVPKLKLFIYINQYFWSFKINKFLKILYILSLLLKIRKNKFILWPRVLSVQITKLSKISLKIQINFGVFLNARRSSLSFLSVHWLVFISQSNNWNCELHIVAVCTIKLNLDNFQMYPFLFKTKTNNQRCPFASLNL